MQFMTMWRKADLSKGYQNPERKLGVTVHFSEMIELNFEKKMPSIVFEAFLESWKMRGYPHFSFWIPTTLIKICFFPIVKTFATIPVY